MPSITSAAIKLPNESSSSSSTFGFSAGSETGSSTTTTGSSALVSSTTAVTYSSILSFPTNDPTFELSFSLTSNVFALLSSSASNSSSA